MRRTIQIFQTEIVRWKLALVGFIVFLVLFSIISGSWKDIEEHKKEISAGRHLYFEREQAKKLGMTEFEYRSEINSRENKCILNELDLNSVYLRRMSDYEKKFYEHAMRNSCKSGSSELDYSVSGEIFAFFHAIGNQKRIIYDLISASAVSIFLVYFVPALFSGLARWLKY